MPIFEGSRKMSNTIEKKCQMGSRGRRFRTPRKMSKKCQNDSFGVSKMDGPQNVENLRKMSKSNKKCQNLGTVHFGTVHFGYPQNDILTFY